MIYLQKIATLFAIGMFLPLFINLLLILKSYTSKNFRQQAGYKLLLFNSFIYSVYLVAALIDSNYGAGFLFISFLMIPAYVLLLSKKYVNSPIRAHKRQAKQAIEVQIDANKRLKARKARELIRARAKAMWK